MSFTIVTDTCSNLPDDMIEKYGLEVLPFKFISDGEIFTSYTKGEKSDLKKFYDMMRDGKVFTTSLPEMADSEKVFREVLDGGNDVYYMGFSTGLSGGYEAMSSILESLRADYPDRKIEHTDTLAASCGEGLLVYYACEMRDAGKSMDEVKTWVEENKLKLSHWFTVDDLQYLYRGGRVSKTAAFAGTMLNIKPVLHVDDEGHLIPMEKVRGRKRSIKALVDHMKETCDKPIEKVMISHGDCIEDVETLKAELAKEFGELDITVNYVDPVIGAHSGPGTLALFFLASHR